MATSLVLREVSL